MKRNHILRSVKGVFCSLLVLLLTAECFAIPTQAALRSEEDIIALFSGRENAHYNDTQFRLYHEEMALLVANVLTEHEYNVDVIYDDEDSTATEKEYILMCTEVQSKTTDFLALGIDMKVNKKGEVLKLELYLLPSRWEEDQLNRVLPVMAAVYDELHGSMTDEKRRSFVSDLNLAPAGSGYRAVGAFDGLYYEFSISEEKVSLVAEPRSGANLQPQAEYYSEGYELHGAKGYTIRTGRLSRNMQGDYLLDVQLVNESKNPLLFHMTHIQADGYFVGTSIYTQVSPGNTKTEQIHIDAGLLASVGMERLNEVGLYFCVTDQKTGEIIFDYRDVVPLGVDIRANGHNYNTTLFQNKEFRLAVTGSGRISENGTPEVYLLLENGVYGDVLLETEGNCVVGKQEYDVYALGRVSGYSEGLALVRPMIQDLDKNTTVEFDLQISSCNYNTLVAGKVTVTLDSEGKIVRASARMKETAQYEAILEKEYCSFPGAAFP